MTTHQHNPQPLSDEEQALAKLLGSPAAAPPKALDASIKQYARLQEGMTPTKRRRQPWLWGISSTLAACLVLMIALPSVRLTSEDLRPAQGIIDALSGKQEASEQARQVPLIPQPEDAPIAQAPSSRDGFREVDIIPQPPVVASAPESGVMEESIELEAPVMADIASKKATSDALQIEEAAAKPEPSEKTIRPAEPWLKDIQTLAQSKEPALRQRAKEQLEAFQAAYPDHPVPKSLLKKLNLLPKKQQSL